jgi:hypothetical protein
MMQRSNSKQARQLEDEEATGSSGHNLLTYFAVAVLGFTLAAFFS